MIELPERIPTPRLVLRPHHFDDVSDIMTYAVAEEWSRYMPVPYPYQPEDAEEWLTKHSLRNRETHAAWAITLNDRVVGAVDLILTPSSKAASLGYALSPSEWNKGFMTEAVQAVMDTAFRTLPDLNRIWAWTDSRNAASLRVLEKLGMRREGCLREHHVIRDEFVDAVYCGILRAQWERQQSA